LSIQMVGLLIISGLLVLPAAAARNVTHSVRGYTAVAICISLFSGMAGIIASYYLGTASGATIVLTVSGVYCGTAALGFWRTRGL
jgi:zinc transport system permease protein